MKLQGVFRFATTCHDNIADVIVLPTKTSATSLGAYESQQKISRLTTMCVQRARWTMVAILARGTHLDETRRHTCKRATAATRGEDHSDHTAGEDAPKVGCRVAGAGAVAAQQCAQTKPVRSVLN